MKIGPRIDMKTTVVNLTTDEYDIRIDRSTPFGNPYSHKDGTKAQFRVPTRKDALDAYKRLLEGNAELQELVRPLKGKRLGCWCKPHKACHGDIIAEFLERDNRITELFGY